MVCGVSLLSVENLLQDGPEVRNTTSRAPFCWCKSFMGVIASECDGALWKVSSASRWFIIWCTMHFSTDKCIPKRRWHTAGPACARSPDCWMESFPPSWISNLRSWNAIDYEVDRKVRSRNKLCTYKAIMQRSPFSFILIFRFIANSSVDGWMENLFISPTRKTHKYSREPHGAFFLLATYTRRLAERSRLVNTQSARLSSKSEFQPLQLAITCEIASINRRGVFSWRKKKLAQMQWRGKFPPDTIHTPQSSTLNNFSLLRHGNRQQKNFPHHNYQSNF